MEERKQRNYMLFGLFVIPIYIITNIFRFIMNRNDNRKDFYNEQRNDNRKDLLRLKPIINCQDRLGFSSLGIYYLLFPSLSSFELLFFRTLFLADEMWRGCRALVLWGTVSHGSLHTSRTDPKPAQFY